MFRRMGKQTGKKKKLDRKNNRARQKNKRGDSKVESNDSPETSDILGLLSGSCEGEMSVVQ